MVIERKIKPHEVSPSYLRPVTRPVASQIRTSVASPGGTTIHGLKVMEDSGVRGALMGAILRGTERAKELRPSE